MILTPKFHTETVKHKSPTPGVPPVDVPGCIVQQARSSESLNRNGGTYLTTQLVVMVPPEHAARMIADDRLTVRGSDYKIDGQPVGTRGAFTGDTAMVPVVVTRISAT